jgi:hypothetical protein
MNRIKILEEALRLTSKDRLETHGTPYLNHRRIADLWTAYLETPITPEQVAICQALVPGGQWLKTASENFTITPLVPRKYQQSGYSNSTAALLLSTLPVEVQVISGTFPVPPPMVVPFVVLMFIVYVISVE